MTSLAALIVPTIIGADAGKVKRINSTPGGHLADGMTAVVALGGGAYSTITDPTSFENGGPEWTMRYGNPESIRYSVASLLESYDYLLSGAITQDEAARRLKLLRRARAALQARAGQ